MARRVDKSMKKEMTKDIRKKAVSSVIVVVLLVVIVLLLMIIIWNVVKLQIKNAQEDNLARTELLVDTGTIDNIQRIDADTINLTITKGSGKIVLVNESEIEVPVTVDVVSVVDLSSSMLSIANCRMDKKSSCCIAGNGCNDEYNCTACNGVWNGENCELINIASTCCLNGTAYNRCTNDSLVCTNCNGLNSTKLDEAKIANTNFIQQVLNISGNRVGLVGFGNVVYNTTAYPYSLAPTSDFGALNLTINSWTAPGATCICCGVNKAIDYLSASSNSKAIIVMSDGVANYNCTPPISDLRGAKIQAINSAGNAWTHGIRVYTIGLGTTGTDFATLSNMSLEGNGTYHYSDTSALSAIYSQVYNDIKKTYDNEKKIAHIKVVFYDINGKSWEYRISGSEAPGPLETRPYSINMTGSGLSNITQIKIYPVVVTESGKYVVGPAWAVIDFKDV